METRTTEEDFFEPMTTTMMTLSRTVGFKHETFHFPATDRPPEQHLPTVKISHQEKSRKKLFQKFTSEQGKKKTLYSQP